MSTASHVNTHVTNMTAAAAARNYYNEHPEELQTKASSIRAFARGAISGLGTGTLMSIIVAGVLAAGTLFTGGLATFGMAAFLTPLMSTAAIMIPATAIFSGFMGAKNNLSNKSSPMSVVPIPIAGTNAPAIYQSQEPSLETAEQAPAKNWVASASRAGGSQSRVQEILDKGMADKDRAAAILAAREASNAEPSQRLM